MFACSVCKPDKMPVKGWIQYFQIMSKIKIVLAFVFKVFDYFVDLITYFISNLVN